MPKLTKRTIDAVQPRGGSDVFVWDEDVPGFGLRVKPSGAKSFIAQYRNQNGRSRRITIGRYGVLTPDQGRQQVRLLLADVLRGADPAADRASARAAMTVEELCREYLLRCEKGLIITRRGQAKKSSTLYTDRGRIDRHIIPLIGKRTVRDVTTADLRGFLRDVIAGKTQVDIKTKARGRAIVKGGKGTATRTMGLVGSIFGYAVGEGYREDNPVRGIALPAYGKRRLRLDAEKYGLLGKALRKAENDGASWQSVLCIRLLALTGCRRSEVTELKKSEIDLKHRALRLADSKTGESLRPLGAAAIAVIQDAMSRSEGPWLFPAIKGDGAYGGLPKTWLRIVTPTLLGITPHALRHSFASVSDDLGYSEATTGAMLGHAGSGTTRGYIHKLDPALVAAADSVAATIHSMLTLPEKSSQPGSNPDLEILETGSHREMLG